MWRSEGKWPHSHSCSRSLANIFEIEFDLTTRFRFQFTLKPIHWHKGYIIYIGVANLSFKENQIESYGPATHTSLDTCVANDVHCRIDISCISLEIFVAKKYLLLFRQRTLFGGRQSSVRLNHRDQTDQFSLTATKKSFYIFADNIPKYKIQNKNRYGYIPRRPANNGITDLYNKNYARECLRVSNVHHLLLVVRESCRVVCYQTVCIVNSAPEFKSRINKCYSETVR